MGLSKGLLTSLAGVVASEQEVKGGLCGCQMERLGRAGGLSDGGNICSGECIIAGGGGTNCWGGGGRKQGDLLHSCLGEV